MRYGVTAVFTVVCRVCIVSRWVLSGLLLNMAGRLQRKKYDSENEK